MENREIKHNVVFTFTREKLIFALFFLYFCKDIVYSIIARTLGSEAIFYTYNLLFIVIILFYCILNRFRDLLEPLACITSIFSIIALTMLIHPEYEEWFFHPFYGIDMQFLSFQGGIWAFLVVWLAKDKENLYRYLKICASFLIIFYSLQYLTAYLRGYWIYTNIIGEQVESAYNLEFGYHMLFPVSVFGAVAYLEKRRLFFIPFMIGSILIIMGGSRGAMVEIPLIFLFAVPFKWKNILNKRRLVIFLLILLVLPLFYLAYLNYEFFLNYLSEILASHGINSRSLTALTSGSFSDGNGRERIYEIVIDLIKTGGFFGRGVYGERIHVGEEYMWGYSHNIVLEMLVSFGYVGGTIIILLLCYGLLFFYKHCKAVQEQIIFICFFVPSFKLLFSDSFWYKPSFWALIAFYIGWKRQYKSSFKLKEYEKTNHLSTKKTEIKT